MTYIVRAHIRAHARSSYFPPAAGWENPWLAIIARLAKAHGPSLDWSPHLNKLFGLFLSALDLPIGTADSVKVTLKNPS